jgi:hypothetical protein
VKPVSLCRQCGNADLAGEQYLGQRDKMEFDIHEVDRLLAIELARVGGSIGSDAEPPEDDDLASHEVQ